MCELQPDRIAERLRTEVVDVLKRRFVGRDEVVELIALAIASGEHLFLHGPPGTAKSALIREFARSVKGNYFEYLLTRFSEPNEIFGPIDLARLREGTVATVTTGMLPEAEFVFLDELFNANSAILNNLLGVLNERIYRRGAETHALPVLSLFSASNRLADDDALKALFDRFLLRCHVDDLPRERVPALLLAGRALETEAPIVSSITARDLRALAERTKQIDVHNIMEEYADVVFRIRDLGIELSDRRVVKALKLVAGSAVLRGSALADVSDFWVLRYLWDRVEQIGPLGALVDRMIEPFTRGPGVHPAAAPRDRVDAETIARELDALAKELESGPKTLVAIARVREKLADLADRSAWVQDDQKRVHLLERSRQYQKKLG